MAKKANGSTSSTVQAPVVAKAIPPTLSHRGLALARIGIVVFALGIALGSVIVAAIASMSLSLSLSQRMR